MKLHIKLQTLVLGAALLGLAGTMPVEGMFKAAMGCGVGSYILGKKLAERYWWQKDVFKQRKQLASGTRGYIELESSSKPLIKLYLDEEGRWSYLWGGEDLLTDEERNNLKKVILKADEYLEVQEDKSTFYIVRKGNKHIVTTELTPVKSGKTPRKPEAWESGLVTVGSGYLGMIAISDIAAFATYVARENIAWLASNKPPAVLLLGTMLGSLGAYGLMRGYKYFKGCSVAKFKTWLSSLMPEMPTQSALERACTYGGYGLGVAGAALFLAHPFILQHYASKAAVAAAKAATTALPVMAKVAAGVIAKK